MVRLKAPDYLTQEKDKSKLPERIEFIYYQERWEGRDHRGVSLNPVSEHIEGYWTKQFTRPHFNQENGEIDYNQLDTARAQTIYYIPYSKSSGRYYSQVSTHRQRQYSLHNKVCEYNPWGQPQTPTRNQFTYEQFANWKWDDIYKHNFKPTVQAYMEWVNKEKQKDGLSFDPS